MIVNKSEVCFYCGAPIDKDYVEKYGLPRKEMDHYWPKSLGGGDEQDNLVPSCQRCNSKKSAKTPKEWADYCFWHAMKPIYRLRWLIGQDAVDRIAGMLDEYRMTNPVVRETE